jgi:hypothetical protein
MQSGQPEMMQQGFQIYASLKTPDAVKPQLVERWNPATNQVEKVWMTPGSSDGVMAGLAKPDAINFNQPFLPDGTPNLAYQSYSKDKAKAGATNVSLNSNAVLEKEEGKEKGKFNVQMYADAATSAKTARKLNSQLEIMRRYVDATGWGAGAKSVAAGFFASFGVPGAEDYATNAQTFNAAAKEVVLQKQLMQKGPQTESDAKRIEETGASLSNTPQANTFILDVAKAQNNRDIQYQTYLDNYWRKNGTYEGAEDEWYRGEGGKSLFDTPELKKYNINSSAVRSQADQILRGR